MPEKMISRTMAATGWRLHFDDGIFRRIGVDRLMELFSQRYADLLRDENGRRVDGICGEIPFDVRKRLSIVLLEFCEPKTCKISRYSSETVKVDVFKLAVLQLNDALGYTAIDIHLSYPDGLSSAIQRLWVPNLFDLIELQYEELSEKEQEPFRTAINEEFRGGKVPWLLVDGCMCKIDSTQFEHDMKAQAVKRMEELICEAPTFQSAYAEYLKAIEFLNKGDNAEAITNACKSYESVMKIICADEDKANAGQLVKRIVNEGKVSLPAGIKSSAFQSNVLMSLPFLRNNIGAHGSGAVDTRVPSSLANLAVNLAAALDTYLIDEYASGNVQELKNDGDGA